MLNCVTVQLPAFIYLATCYKVSYLTQFKASGLWAVLPVASGWPGHHSCPTLLQEVLPVHTLGRVPADREGCAVCGGEEPAGQAGVSAVRMRKPRLPLLGPPLLETHCLWCEIIGQDITPHLMSLLWSCEVGGEIQKA